MQIANCACRAGKPATRGSGNEKDEINTHVVCSGYSIVNEPLRIEANGSCLACSKAMLQLGLPHQFTRETHTTLQYLPESPNIMITIFHAYT
jgi:hypothetical protein